MKSFKILTLILLVINLASGCGTKADDTNIEPATPVDEFGIPKNFTAIPAVYGAKIHFDKNSTVVGYRLYYGDTTSLSGLGSGYLPSPITTTANSLTVGNLHADQKYYFAITAVNAKGTESERTATIEVIPTNPH